MLPKLLVSLLLGWSLHLITDHNWLYLRLTFGLQMEKNQVWTTLVSGRIAAPSSQNGNIWLLVIRQGNRRWKRESHIEQNLIVGTQILYNYIFAGNAQCWYVQFLREFINVFPCMALIWQSVIWAARLLLSGPWERLKCADPTWPPAPHEPPSGPKYGSLVLYSHFLQPQMCSLHQRIHVYPKCKGTLTIFIWLSKTILFSTNIIWPKW